MSGKQSTLDNIKMGCLSFVITKLFPENNQSEKTHPLSDLEGSEGVIGLSAGDERARMFATRFCRLVSVLSQSSSVVATTSGQKSVNVCPPPKNALPLPTQTSNNACHCKTRSLTIKIIRL